MSERNDGGQAFPRGPGNNVGATNGMSLRDYFAAAALQGMLASPSDSLDLDSINKAGKGDGHLGFAVVAYTHADAMLRAREA